MKMDETIRKNFIRWTPSGSLKSVVFSRSVSGARSDVRSREEYIFPEVFLNPVAFRFTNQASGRAHRDVVKMDIGDCGITKRCRSFPGLSAEEDEAGTVWTVGRAVV